MPDTYQVIVADIDGTPIEEIGATNLLYSYVLNGPGSCSFVLPLRDTKSTRANLEPGARTVLVKRNQTLVWAGPLWSLQATMDGVQVSAAGWFDLLRHRIINWTQDYVSWDQVDLAWDLISQTQAQQYGGIGIARGTAPTSHVLRTIHYGAEECKVLGDAIDELATMSNGFDYEIQPDLTWMTYYPSKGLDKGITFEFGKNISGIAWTLDASAMVNQLTGIGSGSGPNTLKSVASDAVLENAYGLLQGSMTFSDITQQGILDTRTFEALRLVKVVRSQPQLQVYTNDPPFGSYGIGDIVQINAQDGFFNLAEKKRIISIVVAVSNEGVDNVGLEFAEPLP